MTAQAWTELVSTALLGTERHPLPDSLAAPWVPAAGLPSDPPSAVLSLAARRRALALAAPPPEPAAAGPDLGPPAPAPRWAADRAQRLLLRVLAPPQAELVTLWLTAAVERGVHAWPGSWTPLATLAARQRDVARGPLAAALGDRGRWFVAQNPRWAALSAELSAAPGDSVPKSPRAVAWPTPAQLAHDPSALLSAPTPWPAEWTRAFLESLSHGTLGSRAVGLAAAVGARMPLEQRELLDAVVQQPSATDPPSERWLRAAWAALGRALDVRSELAAVFDDPRLDEEDHRGDAG